MRPKVTAMRLSDLLGTEVVDSLGQSVGRVHDVRLVQDGPLQPNMMAALRLAGLVVGSGAVAGRLGYDRGEVQGPWLIATVARRLAARARYVPWEQVAERGATIVLSVPAGALRPPAAIAVVMGGDR